MMPSTVAKVASHFYANIIGTKVAGDGEFYWLTFPGHQYGDDYEWDVDWNYDIVSEWDGPFASRDAAIDALMDAYGNAGSYDTADPLLPEIVAQMVPGLKHRGRWGKLAAYATNPLMDVPQNLRSIMQEAIRRGGGRKGDVNFFVDWGSSGPIPDEDDLRTIKAFCEKLIRKIERGDSNLPYSNVCRFVALGIGDFLEGKTTTIVPREASRLDKLASTWTYRPAREDGFGWLVLMDGEFVRQFSDENQASRFTDQMNEAERQSAEHAKTERDPEEAFGRSLQEEDRRLYGSRQKTAATPEERAWSARYEQDDPYYDIPGETCANCGEHIILNVYDTWVHRDLYHWCHGDHNSTEAVPESEMDFEGAKKQASDDDEMTEEEGRRNMQIREIGDLRGTLSGIRVRKGYPGIPLQSIWDFAAMSFEERDTLIADLKAQIASGEIRQGSTNGLDHLHRQWRRAATKTAYINEHGDEIEVCQFCGKTDAEVGPMYLEDDGGHVCEQCDIEHPTEGDEDPTAGFMYPIDR